MNKENTLRLIYHYWDGSSEATKKLHFEMLKIYAKVFTDIIFVISSDKINEEKHINNIKHEIIDLGFTGNTTIIVSDNNENLREAVTFKKYIVDKLGELDGLTFFAHSRGGSVGYIPEEYLYQLIIFLYYGCLNWIDDVKYYLLNNYNKLTYGGILDKKTEDDATGFPKSKNKVWYQGTFQWLNTKKILQRIKSNGIIIPDMNDRFYGEVGFMSEMFDEFYFANHSGNVMVDPHGNWYDDTYQLIHDTIGNENEYKNYIEFSNNIIEKLFGKRYDR